MLKKYLLVLAAAGAISMVAPFAAAQDSQANDQSARRKPMEAIATVHPIPPSAPRNSPNNSISPPTSKEKY